jgi:acetyl esterase/lipase
LLSGVLSPSRVPACDAKAEAPPPAEKKNDAPTISEKKTDSPKIPDTLHYLPDQAYWILDDDTNLMLDILRPKAAKGPLPTVICLHGGGWVKGSRKTNLPIMIKLAEAGYAAVSVQYRFAPDTPFPGPVHDVKCAVRWLRANANLFNLDIDRFAALGYSSGGNMACLLGLTTPLDGLEGKGGCNGYRSDVNVVISFAGISDMAQWYKDGGFLVRFCLNRYMTDSPDKAPELYKEASPISYARGNLAAMLLIHGTEDEWVSFNQSEELEKVLKDAKANVQLLPIKGARHILTGDAEKEADDAALRFLDDYFRLNRAGKPAEKRPR